MFTARKQKLWWKGRFLCYLRLSAKRTSNQDGLFHDPTASKVTQYPQITKFPWRTSRMCNALPRALYSTSVWIHIRKAKHTPNSTASVLFKALCTQDLKSREAAKWSNCVRIHAMHTKQSFPVTKVWIVQILHNSVSCTAVSMKPVQRGSSSTIVSPFLHHISLDERNPKTP